MNILQLGQYMKMSRSGFIESISRLSAIALALLLFGSCTTPGQMLVTHDVVLRGGTLYDGSGGVPMVADLAIDGDRISAMGDLSDHRGETEIDVTGLAVAPGFINMLSWANTSLIQDGRSLSDIYQGVTLEVMGEGSSMGPLNPEMKRKLAERQTDITYDVGWSTLGGYLQFLEDRGISTNVASFVGAATVRAHELGTEGRDPTAQELGRMMQLVREAMEEGAMGVGSSLPYTPGAFASTEELTALASAAAEYDGMYISHIRNEGDEIFAALDEFLTIVRESGIRGEVYHLKVSHKRNWDKLDAVIEVIGAARAEGLQVTADIYTYHASSTGLNYDLPTWVKQGEHAEQMARLRDPEIRRRVVAETEMIPPEDILLVSFRSEGLRHLTGKTLAEVSAMRGTSPVETAMDLIAEDDSRIGTVRFTMNEDNIRKKITLPWVSFCSDSASLAPEAPFTNAQPHPRAYGSFARLLGKYVREEELISLEQAIHRLSGLPAANLKLDRRGRLAPGFFADVVAFDPELIIDQASFEKPHQLATGMQHVFVNGEAVLRNGEHTGSTPGRFVKGPGWVDHPNTESEEVHTGSIGGALYTVVKPAAWQGKLLIFAHGLRPESEPLRAGLNTERPLYRELLDQGWMVATSSYRRNGIIVRDAIEDLDLLRKHIAGQYGEPERTLVMGNSMGGIIGTLIAETRFDDYDGILAAGAAMRALERSDAAGLSHDPKIPILFLTNRSEIEGPERYVQGAASATVPPALWRVDRDGHVNVNDQERLAALRALEHFIETGQLERDRDGTIATTAVSTALFSETGVEATITGVSVNHGNIFTSLVPGDLERLGVGRGDHFSLTINGTTVKVLLGTDYRDVGQGEWIGIMRAEGFLMIAQNFVNACETLACETGDRLLVSLQP